MAELLGPRVSASLRPRMTVGRDVDGTDLSPAESLLAFWRDAGVADSFEDVLRFIQSGPSKD